MPFESLVVLILNAIEDFDLAYIRDVIFVEGGIISVADSDFIAGQLLTSVKAEHECSNIQGLSEAKGSSLARCALRARPATKLQRNGSSSSVQSNCSQRLHEQLRFQQSLTSFPRLQKRSFLFWRKRSARGKHRSLHGKTVPYHNDRLVQETP